MTTSNDPRGRLAELYSASQTALITPAASPGQTFQRRHFYDWTPSPQEARPYCSQGRGKDP